jgi:hypothetical protein
MPRRFEANQLLTALVDAFQKDGHETVFHGNRAFARIETTDQDGVVIMSEVNLSDIAERAAGRLSQ